MYTEKELQSIGIFELRTIARQLGVGSPTTKRHAELVACIINAQNGTITASHSNKGRPPKKITMTGAVSTYDLERAEGTTMSPFKYGAESGECISCADGEVVDSINKKYSRCQGILRDVDGKKYIYNLESGTKFVMVENSIVNQNHLWVGDFIIGQAYEATPKTGILEKIESVNFNHIASEYDAEADRATIQNLDLQKLYGQLQESSKPIKIVVELEIDEKEILTLKDQAILFYSKELDAIKRSFNALLDCLQLVKNLSKNNKPYSLFLVDIDYIYTILNAYLSSQKEMPYGATDAGQFIKELLTYVKKSSAGNMVIYQSERYRRNEYLDAILNKYI